MPPSDAPSTEKLRDTGNRILTAGVILALLYFGRSVLLPVTLAILLSFLVEPIVRGVQRIGAGRALAVLTTVVALALACAAIAMLLGTQMLRIAEQLPQYEATVQRKLKTLDDATIGRLRVISREASRLMQPPETPAEEPPAPVPELEGPVLVPQPKVVVVEPHPAAPPPLQLDEKLLSSLWAPLQATGIVLLVLVFVLLEHESLRDRFIRLAGATDIRSTTLALADAAERLSRLFVSQFLVNLIFGLAIWACLSLLHFPQAMLCGALAGVMRFVPYVGTAIAAVFSAALAFAVDPGWSLAASTLGTFVCLDLIAAQLLEPHVYGHATGLTPLSVVVAAIFWSALWGPVGLIVSIPLTLCLVVAGRHMKALGMLEVALSDAQPLTLPQRFYQRALSGDSQEIIANARVFLKTDSLAGYCDRVLIPALHLAQLDASRSMSGGALPINISRVVLEVVAAFSSENLKLPSRAQQSSILEDLSAAGWLRHEREELIGRWQGPLGVPPGSVVICLGLGAQPDGLAAELLVRLLRLQHIDARRFSIADLDAGLPPGATPDGTAIVYLVSAFPNPERERIDAISKQVHALFERALVVRVLCPGVTGLPQIGKASVGADHLAGSLVQAIEICQSWKEAHDKLDPAPPRIQPRDVQPVAGMH
ncbi:MAG TPA: AI-2E family transporter [Steroidobacteraceae bacterium]|nr:AI-2E family transporter [Steroidobacteraceae bacterium]